MDELKVVETEDEWAAYHAIRERVLWEARAKSSKYDPNHPDDRIPSNFPLLYVSDEKTIGVLRVDLDNETAWFRRVAVDEEYQKQGYGTKMIEAAITFARAKGCGLVRSNVARDAVGFYEKVGFTYVDEVHPDGGIPMAKQL
jgi:GNAT superfamily N-acetyltransferase